MKNKYMLNCLNYALKKVDNDELPIAALLIKDNKIVCKSVNNKNLKNNVLGHAEIRCIQKASKKLKRWNLSDCELYVTLKPCEMCELVIKESRIKSTYYLLDRLETKKVYQKSQFIPITGMEKEKKQYQEKLKKFFENKR